MKNPKLAILAILVVLSSVGLVGACTFNDPPKPKPEQEITKSDKDALLFMLEEEKLARDTYNYLYDVWGFRIFNNISNSEQIHMNEMSGLLELYGIPYTILDKGEFSNRDLQNYYDAFAVDGKKSLDAALQIGATIEDLDIVDLERYKNASTNSTILASFNRLQCGSRNHLRSYVSNIERGGQSYTPQFLSTEAYNSIINGSHERCN